MRLFVERAQAAKQGFRLTEQAAPAVVQICRRLDGIPLAIELAAARTRLLTPEDIAEHLDDRFNLLTGGSRAALPRQQTLHALIDWSYNLLTLDERRLFQRIAVFRGGFTLEAAEQVCVGAEIQKGELVDLLSRLVDKSLVSAEAHNGSTRYGMFETIREYAHAKFDASDVAEYVRGRHLAYYLDWAKRASQFLKTDAQLVWSDQLDAELENLRAALLESRNTMVYGEKGLELAATLWQYWDRRGMWSEARRWLNELIPTDYEQASEHSLPLADALSALGFLAWLQGDVPTSNAAMRAAVRISRARHEPRSLSGALARLSYISLVQGEFTAASENLSESLALFRGAGDPWGIAYALNGQALVALYQGDYEDAAAQFRESLQIYRTLGDRWGIAMTLNGQAELARAEHRFADAIQIYGVSLHLRRELDDKSGIASSLHNVAQATYECGDAHGAGKCFGEALQIFQQLGNIKGTAHCLAGLGAVQWKLGAAKQAVSFLATADAILKRIGEEVEPIDRPLYEKSLSEARDYLSPQAFVEAWNDGTAMTTEQAMQIAFPAGTGPS